jgi:chorismate dehydratase
MPDIGDCRMLKIGRIDYANLYPIFRGLERIEEAGRSHGIGYEFIRGVPSRINALMQEGTIDVGPSSSIEYLKRPDLYSLVEGHSISSSGPIGSIFLFSRQKIEELAGCTVLASEQSETSTALLRIILGKFYAFDDVVIKPSVLSLDEGLKAHPAYMLIGDDAMRAELTAQAAGLRVYDLGDLWHRRTGFPFVFALWIARADRVNQAALKNFSADLDKARRWALDNLEAIADGSPYLTVFTKERLIDYWRNISYDLSETHMAGLELFRKYAAEMGLIP